MMLIISAVVIVALIISVSVMVVRVKAATATATELKAENDRLQAQLADKREEAGRLAERMAMMDSVTAELDKTKAELIRNKEDNSRLTERIRFHEEEKSRIAAETEERFRNLANDILDANSRKFKEQNETRISEILTPLKENIDKFSKTIAESYSNEARERFALDQRIKELIELNQSIGKEAKDLTHALRGNSKIQGDWGEMILETILDKSGLKKDIHFTIQQTVDSDGNTLRGDDGRGLRPDAVINYPDGRCVVIDSKVSLTNYMDYVNADDAAARDEAGRRHIQSVKTHIKELSVKNYQEYIGEKKTDFVMMFIPNEGAYIAAMQLDSNLWQEAYDRRVLIISPTHLISVIRLIAQLWKQDDMKRNVIDIATESGRMYDKFVGFIEDLQKIEKGLDTARTAYTGAFRKLKDGPGNLIGKAEKLRVMGAKVQKRIDSSLLPEETE